MRVFVHVLGESDIGVDSQRRIQAQRDDVRFDGDLPTRVGVLTELLDRQEKGADERAGIERLLRSPVPDEAGPRLFVPLQAVLRGFESGDQLLLVATSSGDRGDTRSLGEQICRALRQIPDLFGPSVSPAGADADAVELVVTSAPNVESTFEQLSERLVDLTRRYRPTEIVTGVGTGATQAWVAVLMSTLSAGPRVTAVPIQEAAHGSQVRLMVDNDPSAWLARRRMFGALAAYVGAAHEETQNWLLLLDARQRIDLGRYRELARELRLPDDDPLSPIDDAPHGLPSIMVKRPRMTSALADAYVDLLVRREVRATMTGRAWLLAHYYMLYNPGDPHFREFDRGELLGNFLDRATRRQYVGSAAVDFLADATFISEVVGDHHHGLWTPSPKHRRDAIREAVTHAESLRPDPRAHDPRLRDLDGLPADLDPFIWSPVPSGRFLVAYCVGKQEEPPNGRRPFAEALSDAGWRTEVASFVYGCTSAEAENAPLSPIVLLVASAQTAQAAARSAAYLAERLGETPGEPASPSVVEVPITVAQAQASEEVQAGPGTGLSAIEVARGRIARSLLEEREFYDAEAVVALVAPGHSTMNIALLLAAADVATKIGSPFYVGSMPPGPDGTQVQVATSQVAALPGYPRLLIEVAARHLADLEISAAAAVLARGGPRLADLAARAAEVRAGFVEVGNLGPDRRIEVVRRIELIRTVLARGYQTQDRRALDDWHALHLAMTIADAILNKHRGKSVPWYAGTVWGRTAYSVRNKAPATHAESFQTFATVLGRFRRSQRVSRCDELLAKVQAELLDQARRAREAAGQDPDGTSPTYRELVKKYDNLLNALNAEIVRDETQLTSARSV